MSSIAAIDGSGERRVLVLHGWALDSTVWLAARVFNDVENFTYAYMDFPGYGVSADAPLAEGIDGMAWAGMEAADELGWDTFAILGHSMGGATAIRMAVLAPDRVKSVVAVTPVSPGGTPLDAATYTSFVQAWADPASAIKGALSPEMSDDDLARLVARNRSTMSQPVWEKYLANWTGSDFLEEVPAYPGPVALLYGESDPFVTPEYLAETVAVLSDGSVQALVGSGHYPMIEAAERSVGIWEAALAKA